MGGRLATAAPDALEGRTTDVNEGERDGRVGDEEGASTARHALPCGCTDPLLMFCARGKWFGWEARALSNSVVCVPKPLTAQGADVG